MHTAIVQLIESLTLVDPNTNPHLATSSRLSALSSQGSRLSRLSASALSALKLSALSSQLSRLPRRAMAPKKTAYYARAHALRTAMALMAMADLVGQLSVDMVFDTADFETFEKYYCTLLESLTKFPQFLRVGISAEIRLCRAFSTL